MASPTYLDFDLLVERTGDTCRARVLSSPAGEATAAFTLPFDPRDLENFVLRVLGMGARVRRMDAPEMAQIKEFGGKLFDAVFDGAVGTCLARSIDQAKAKGVGLRLRLRTEDSPSPAGVSLFDVPWEFLYDRAGNEFLSLSEDTPLVRYPDLPQAPEALAVEPPLNVLVIISSPAGFPELDIEREWSKLQEATSTLRQGGRLTLDRLEAPTLETLQAKLRRGGPYHVFHFVGHGRFNAETQGGELLLQDETGKGNPVSGEVLQVLLRGHESLRLAILNACEGARTSAQDPFAGTAQTLVQGGIPAVIAMQMAITDQAAITLSQEFYAALADGYPVDGALSEARKAIYARVSTVEWAIPVLYLRAPDGRIFDIRPSAPGSTPPITRRDEATPPPPTRRDEPVPLRRGPKGLIKAWARPIPIGIAAAAVIAVVLFLALRGGGSPVGPPTSTGAGPSALPLGSLWERIAGQSDLGGAGAQIMNRVVGASSGWVAAGNAFADGGADAAVWTSPDGKAWTRVRPANPLADPLGGEGTQEINMLVAGGPGFVAVGDSSIGGEFDAAVWTSVDGTVWQRVAGSGVFDGAGDQVMNRIVSSPLGLIAVGYESVGNETAAAIWRSGDPLAQTWERVADQPSLHGSFDPAGGTDLRIRGVTVLGSTVVAVGFENTGGTELRDAAAWTSTDGTTWTRAPDGPVFGGRGSQQMATVAAGGPGLVAVGDDDSHGTALDSAVWTSTDGATWTRVADPRSDLGGAFGQGMTYVIQTGAGLFAVGFDETDAAVWTSADGAAWTEQPDPNLVFTGAGAQVMDGAAVFGDLVVAVGTDNSTGNQNAAVWRLPPAGP